MKKLLAALLAATSSLSGVASSVSKAEIFNEIHQVFTPGTMEGVYAVNKFDPVLGTLMWVSAGLGTFQSTGFCVRNYGQAQTQSWTLHGLTTWQVGSSQLYADESKNFSWDFGPADGRGQVNPNEGCESPPTYYAGGGFYDHETSMRNVFLDATAGDDISNFVGGGTLDTTFSMTDSISGLTDDFRYTIDAKNAQGWMHLTYYYRAADVPEPAMVGLFGLGAIGLGLSRRRKV